MTDLLFDTPWWLPTLLIVLGIVLFVTGNNRRETGIRGAGIVAVLLAAALILLSVFVQTDREKAESGSRALVAAAVARDWGVFERLLDERASVSVLGAGTVAANRRDIIAVATDGSQRFGLKAAHITSLVAKRQQSEVMVTMDVLTEQTMYPYPLPSTWQLEWVHTADGMRVFRVTNLKIGNQTGKAAEADFPRP
jgi:hypothetical protein